MVQCGAKVKTETVGGTNRKSLILKTFLLLFSFSGLAGSETQSVISQTEKTKPRKKSNKGFRKDLSILSQSQKTFFLRLCAAFPCVKTILAHFFPLFRRNLDISQRISSTLWTILFPNNNSAQHIQLRIIDRESIRLGCLTNPL